MSDVKEFNFNFFLDNLKKYYFVILLLMVIIDYILYYQLGFELSYFTYIIDINFDVDKIIWTMIFPFFLFINFFILYIFFNFLIEFNKNKNLSELKIFKKIIFLVLVFYIGLLLIPLINNHQTFSQFLINYDFFILLFEILFSILVAILIFGKIYNINIIGKIRQKKYKLMIFIILNTFWYYGLFMSNNIILKIISYILFFELLIMYSVYIAKYEELIKYEINIILYFSIFTFFSIIYLINNHSWNTLINSKTKNKIEFQKKFSYNLFLNPFLLQTNNYETLIELDKKGVLEKEFQKSKKFKDKNISYLIVDRNSTKYIRVPIDGEEANSTHFITSKILPLSKNNAIHFIINPKDCNYTNKTCNIVALMTSYHQAGNKEYYKLLTYSIIEGQLK